MKNIVVTLLCVASLGFVNAPAFAQQNGRVVIEFQGFGGHSNFDYGRTSALHAAGRAIVGLRAAGLAPGSYRVTSFGGGNSVNSIASSARYQLELTAPDPTALQVLIGQVKASAKAAADAENAFRGVKDGDLVNGAPAFIRYTVATQ